MCLNFISGRGILFQDKKEVEFIGGNGTSSVTSVAAHTMRWLSRGTVLARLIQIMPTIVNASSYHKNLHQFKDTVALNFKKIVFEACRLFSSHLE